MRLIRLLPYLIHRAFEGELWALCSTCRAEQLLYCQDAGIGNATLCNLCRGPRSYNRRGNCWIDKWHIYGRWPGEKIEGSLRILADIRASEALWWSCESGCVCSPPIRNLGSCNHSLLGRGISETSAQQPPPCRFWSVWRRRSMYYEYSKAISGKRYG